MHYSTEYGRFKMSNFLLIESTATGEAAGGGELNPSYYTGLISKRPYLCINKNICLLTVLNLISNHIFVMNNEINRKKIKNQNLYLVADPGFARNITNHATIPAAKQIPKVVKLAPRLYQGTGFFSSSSCSLPS